ncbi:MAG: hypothetical protein VE96_C0018G0011, partial [candidate division Kazan bacterium GW2011_GWA1_44_22]
QIKASLIQKLGDCVAGLGSFANPIFHPVFFNFQGLFSINRVIMPNYLNEFSIRRHAVFRDQKAVHRVIVSALTG